MPIYTRREPPQRVVFLHIPKTGGSSIEHAMRAAGYDQALYDGGAYLDPPQHWTADMLATSIKDGFDIAFTVVRHPLDRLRSEYDYQCSSRHPLRHVKVQPLLTTADFDTWVNYVLDRYDADPSIYGHHMRPQVEYLLPGVIVLRYEDGHLTRQVRSAGVPCGPVLNFNEAAARTTPDVSEATMRRIRTVYAEDYRRFGYE